MRSPTRSSRCTWAWRCWPAWTVTGPPPLPCSIAPGGPRPCSIYLELDHRCERNDDKSLAGQRHLPIGGIAVSAIGSMDHRFSRLEWVSLAIALAWGAGLVIV